MITKTNFDEKLCEYAELFYFSKKQTDLFVLLQTNTVTYYQLALSHLHGTSQTAARLALKRLESAGYIQSKSLAKHNNEKYYFLTTYGRNSIQTMFSQIFLSNMKVSMSRRPPAGSQQILHRIKTNDFYYCYLSADESIPRAWILEHPLPQKHNCNDNPPRCDALFIGERYYYIEQDNCTQSETIIHKKIAQYIESGILSPLCETSSMLIFCLSFPHRCRTAGTAPYSTYRLLLKFCKLWDLLQKQHGIEIDYLQFISTLETSCLSSTVSTNEQVNFKLLLKKYPDVDSLGDLIRLKNAYLAHSQDFSITSEELEISYIKRLKSHFSAIYRTFPRIMSSAYDGIPLFAVPNHRLVYFQPFILSSELSLERKLRMYLLTQGLILDGWSYFSPLRIESRNGNVLCFFAGLHHPSFGYIAVEVPYHDLSSLPRVKHNFKTIGRSKNITMLCFTIPGLFDDLQTEFIQNGWAKNYSVLFADAYQAFSAESPCCNMYQIQDNSEPIPVHFDCDLFDGRLRITRKE